MARGGEVAATILFEIMGAVFITVLIFFGTRFRALSTHKSLSVRYPPLIYLQILAICLNLGNFFVFVFKKHNNETKKKTKKQ